MGEYTGEFIEDWDLDGLFVQVRQIFDPSFDEEDLEVESVDRVDLATRLHEDALGAYAEREEELGDEADAQSRARRCCCRSSTSAGASTCTTWTTCARASTCGGSGNATH